MSAQQLTTGYCTNIHAGTDLDALRANLRKFAGPIRQQTRPLAGDSKWIANGDRLGVGLWVPHEAARELVESPAAIEELRGELDDLGLLAYTFNGFPYGNFHQPVVKHRVYEPTWWETARRDYTLDLIRILDGLLPPRDVGSISTLPIGWGKVADDEARRAATHLLQVAQHLRDLETHTGRRIVIAIEPEPGCHFDRADDLITFFERFIPAEERRYLTVCHDVCHAAVMGESQTDVLRRYQAHGIVIGKVQVSSAIRVDWGSKLPEQQTETLNQLAAFAEDRYLHQTGRFQRDGQFVLAEDLPELLRQITDQAAAGANQRLAPPRLDVDDRSWCIHFHVPIFLQHFGNLTATQPEIDEALGTLLSLDSEAYVPHLEIETYAWSVLPPELQSGGLVPSISREIHWLDERLTALGQPPKPGDA